MFKASLTLSKTFTINTTPTNQIGIDYGGTLTKIAYFDEEENEFTTIHIPSNDFDGVIETIKQIPKIKKHLISGNENTNEKQKEEIKLSMTGGGAYRYKTKFQEIFPFPIHTTNEGKCLHEGFGFVLQNVPNPTFQIGSQNQTEKIPSTFDFKQPAIISIMGTGTGFFFSDNGAFRRVGGSGLGGGSFFGLLKLLTNLTDFDQIQKIPQEEYDPINLRVKDILGEGSEEMGLDGNLMASFFGKIATKKKEKEKKEETKKMEKEIEEEEKEEKEIEEKEESEKEKEKEKEKITENHIAFSLAQTIFSNVAQISVLYAKQNNAKSIVFVGGLICDKILAPEMITNYVNYYSNNTIKSVFMKHSTHLGSIGACVLKN
ncbi:pantothenate kinase [Anaeramoeba flamelloides]|uniref:Pantothenate kinase n=1 Tax=Anaeramoeba flamelloides TaxID=1746091 RepID=A0AAV7ZXS5_9EUKA|nr:pantothenate kinase [Anaeramoeba flamelloides]